MGQYVHIKPYKANKHYIRLVHAVKASHEPHAHAVTYYTILVQKVNYTCKVNVLHKRYVPCKG